MLLLLSVLLWFLAIGITFVQSPLAFFVYLLSSCLFLLGFYRRVFSSNDGG